RPELRAFMGFEDRTIPTTAQQRMAVNRVAVFAPNWLGDAVMALPALADVTRALPAAVDVVARPSIAPLFSLVPGVRGVIALPRGDLERLRRDQFDAAILFPNSFQSAFMAWRARIPERWGYRTGGRGLLL